MSPLARFENADWTLVPHRLHAPLERWLTDGIQPKSVFLQRVLRNDLGAVAFADPIERASLIDIVRFLLEECPLKSYGSAAAYNQWIRLNGLRGIRDSEMNYEPPSSWRGKLWKPGNKDEDE